MSTPKYIKNLRINNKLTKEDLLYKEAKYCPDCKDYYVSDEDKRYIERNGICSTCYHNSRQALNEIIEVL